MFIILVYIHYQNNSLIVNQINQFLEEENIPNIKFPKLKNYPQFKIPELENSRNIEFLKVYDITESENFL